VQHVIEFEKNVETTASDNRKGQILSNGNCSALILQKETKTKLTADQFTQLNTRLSTESKQ